MKAPSDVSESDLRELFDDNFERLRLESGHTLSADVKQAAWEQVRAYWKRLRPLAETVTDTEVRLALPGQRTPQGRPFNIEGVVDIVRGAEKTVMYDVKTHAADSVRANPDQYSEQLNVYAHIWRQLRRQSLDEIAVIATALPPALRSAIRNGDDEAIEREMAAWNPVVPLPLQDGRHNSTLADFARVVDAIEGGQFAPRTATDLDRRGPNGDSIGKSLCANCDVRHSCRSHQDYRAARLPAGPTGTDHRSEDDNERIALALAGEASNGLP